MLGRLFKRSDISHMELLLLSKEDCHLCDEALGVIESVRRRHPFRLRVVKIEEGDEWHERFWDKIPVGLVGGRMIFKYRVTAAELLEKMVART